MKDLNDSPFVAAFGAVLQGSLFGLVSLLPQKYSAVFMSGQGLAGTFAAIAMLLAIGSKPPMYTQEHKWLPNPQLPSNSAQSHWMKHGSLHHTTLYF